MGGVKVIDKATGEYLEFEYASLEDFAAQYDELTQRIAALDRAKKKMAAELKQMMGDEAQLALTNGWYFKKYTSTRKSYPVSLVMELFEDDAQRFLKADKKTIDAELAEHVDDGGRWPAIGSALRLGVEIESATESLRLVKPEAGA